MRVLTSIRIRPAGSAVKDDLVDGGGGPGLCPGVCFRRTRPWFQATGEWRAEGSSLDSAVKDGLVVADVADGAEEPRP